MIIICSGPYRCGRFPSPGQIGAGTPSAADLEEVHAAIDAGLATGRLRPRVAVKLRGLASAALAHEEVISHASTGGSARGKICIATQDDEYILIQFVPRLTHPLANTRSPVAAVDRRTTQCL